MEQIRREYTVNYSIENVKQGIKSISADVMNKYPLTNQNDTFNSYSINIFFWPFTYVANYHSIK